MKPVAKAIEMLVRFAPLVIKPIVSAIRNRRSDNREEAARILAGIKMPPREVDVSHVQKQIDEWRGKK